MKKIKEKLNFISREDLILLRRAFGYVKPHIWLFIGTFITVILGMVFELIQPLYYGRVIDYILKQDLTLVWQTIGIIFGLTIANGGLSLVETYWSDLLSNRIILDIKQDLYAHILNLPMQVFDELQVGEIISRLEGDVGTLSNIITFQSIRIILDVFRVFGIGFIIFGINGTLSWIVVLAFPITYVILGLFGRVLRRKGKEMRLLNDKYYSFITESFAGVREVKALNIEKLVNSKFITWTKKIFGLRINMDVISAVSGLTTMILNTVIRLVVMGMGAFFIISGALTMGTYVAFNNYSAQFNATLGRIAGLNMSIQRAMVSLERIFTLIDNFMLPPEEREGFIPESTLGQLQFSQVDFRYEEDTPTLQNIDFTARPNQMTALVGASGSGKTTIFNLILRFYRPEKGEVCLDNHPIDELHLDYLREQLAIVSQDPYLFNMSIRENLLLAQPEASEEEMVEATKKAYIHHFIDSLPQGYDTVVGERGTRLSGGQKQRLAIARAILKGSKILLFDEATSALDGESEEYIQEVLQELLVNHTVLVIAHRLSTVIQANQIIVLQDGQIVGKGDHASLIADNVTYQRLYQSQLQSIEQTKS